MWTINLPLEIKGLMISRCWWWAVVDWIVSSPLSEIPASRLRILIAALSWIFTAIRFPCSSLTSTLTKCRLSMKIVECIDSGPVHS